MCIMVYLPKGKMISIEKWNSMQESNPDGFGMMYSIDGILYDRKYEAVQKIKEKAYRLIDPVCLHFRTASASDIGIEFCYPIRVNENLAFMMNGNLFEFQSYFGKGFKDNKTDAQRFNEIILQKLPSNFLFRSDTRLLLEEYCKSNHTKLLFMTSGGVVQIINEDAGEWIGGAWYSNYGIENYTGYGYSGAYSYDLPRHKGGLISNKFVAQSRRGLYARCNVCFGYYKGLPLDSVCEHCRPFMKLLEVIEK